MSLEAHRCNYTPRIHMQVHTRTHAHTHTPNRWSLTVGLELVLEERASSLSLSIFTRYLARDGAISSCF